MKHANELDKWTLYELNNTRTYHLAALMAACAAYDVTLDHIYAYCNGYLVTFAGIEGGDAILHDGSYGNARGEWETIGFPWDYNDVSCHDAATLAKYIHAWKNGEAPWDE